MVSSNFFSEGLNPVNDPGTLLFFDVDESQPRIPDEYLVSLFGPKVLEALGILTKEMEKTRAGGKSEVLDLLIAYRWKDMFGGFDRDPATIEWTKA